MYKYISQNKNVIMAAVAVFLVSMSALLFFLASGEVAPQHELKTNLIEAVTVRSMQEDEGHYRKLLNNHEDSVFALALDGVIEFASWNTESKFGYKQKELLHQNFFTFIYPDDLPDLLGVFGKVLQTEHSVNNMGPWRMLNKNGEYRIIIGSAAPLSVSGKIQKIIITTKDITNQILEKNEPEISAEAGNKKSKNNRKTAPKNKKTIRNESDRQDAKIIADK